mgnify:CR=1 FL=1
MSIDYYKQGRRLKKDDGTKETWYVYDANGTVMAIYEYAGSTLTQTELPIYGTGRIGKCDPTKAVDAFNKYIYEITDHLGSVRATFCKDEDGSDTDDDGSAVYDIRSYADYYPFGWTMPGRQWTSSDAYRYGYQSLSRFLGRQFAEDETAQTGFHAFELRLYDSRIGRWTSVDPAGQYWSGYVGMGNCPVMRIDPDGSIDGWVSAKDGKGLVYWDPLINTAEAAEAAGLNWHGMQYFDFANGLIGTSSGELHGMLPAVEVIAERHNKFNFRILRFSGIKWTGDILKDWPIVFDPRPSKRYRGDITIKYHPDDFWYAEARAVTYPGEIDGHKVGANLRVIQDGKEIGFQYLDPKNEWSSDERLYDPSWNQVGVARLKLPKKGNIAVKITIYTYKYTWIIESKNHVLFEKTYNLP